ncbi:MAG: hypothetical protein ABEJ72_08710, partial [Candidatus Aenigmatarchaeota archaeon]
MYQEITFYLLERPRSVSDMIRDLTDKDLSNIPEERSDQIPRIAGNWFREGSGYLWRLEDAGILHDRGRKYMIDRERFTELFVQSLDLQKVFPGHENIGEEAELEDAYSEFLDDYTLGGLKEELEEDIFQGITMAEIFQYHTWEEVLMAEEESDRRIAKRSLILDFWSSVHFSLISSIFKSREKNITDTLSEDRDHYFRWRKRRQRLNETSEGLGQKIVSQSGLEEDYHDRIVDSLGDKGAVMDEDETELLADVYLMAMNEGTELFEEYARYDHD